MSAAAAGSSAAAQSEPRQLQRRFFEASRLLERSRGRKAALAREKIRIEITLRELETPTPATYKSIGKMFLAVGQPEIKTELTKRLETIDVDTAATTRQEQQFQAAAESARLDFIALMQQQQQQQQ